jgi:hypothetical protein
MQGIRIIIAVLFCVVSTAFTQNIDYEIWIDADSEEPEELRNGQYQHPFKYIKEITLPPDTTLKVINFLPAENSYKYDDTSQVEILFNLRHQRNVIIRKYGNGGSVRLEGYNGNIQYQTGIQISGNSSNIEIDGIDLSYFGYNALKTAGPQANYITGIRIKNSRLSYNTGINDTTLNYALIKMQHVRDILIENCELTQGNYYAQLDGIFMDACEDIVIRNNRIVLEENEYIYQHLDCIEITQRPDGPFSGNVTIENNYIENASTEGVTYRQGIHVLYTFGKIKIFNNYVISGKGRALVNVFFHTNTDSVLIYNNTLAGKNNPHNLMRIKNADGLESYDLLEIKNNIFYKEGTEQPVYALTTWFEGLSRSKFNNKILNHNLYWNTDSTVVPVLQFDDGTNRWNIDSSRLEKDGIEADPHFNTDYTLRYSSAAKNKGEGLYLKGISIDHSGYERPYWNSDYDIGANELEDTQLKIAVKDSGANYEVLHSLTAIGKYWQRNSSNKWNPDEATELNYASCITSDLADDRTNLNSLAGFTYSWLKRSSSLPETRIAAGFYKVTNDKDSSYFYLDLRDAVTSGSPNIYIRLNRILNIYQYYHNGWDNDIPDGSVLRISQLNGRSNTKLLNFFWSNALILPEDNRLVWGTAPGENDSTVYLVCIQKDNSTQLEVIDSLAGEYEYSLTGSTLSSSVRYAVVSVTNGEADTSNSVFIQSPAANEDIQQTFNYSLEQNYPNPFNPSTKIKFSIPVRQIVEIKIYDILGREAAVLIKEELPPGTYEKEWNAPAYSSGVYIYRITTEHYTQSRKMINMK